MWHLVRKIIIRITWSTIILKGHPYVAEKLESRWHASCGSTQTSIEIIPFHFGMFHRGFNAYASCTHYTHLIRNENNVIEFLFSSGDTCKTLFKLQIKFYLNRELRDFNMRYERICFECVLNNISVFKRYKHSSYLNYLNYFGKTGQLFTWRYFSNSSSELADMSLAFQINRTASVNTNYNAMYASYSLRALFNRATPL